MSWNFASFSFRKNVSGIHTYQGYSNGWYPHTLLSTDLAPLSKCEVFDLAVQVVESQPETLQCCIIVFTILQSTIISTGSTDWPVPVIFPVVAGQITPSQHNTPPLLVSFSVSGAALEYPQVTSQFARQHFVHLCSQNSSIEDLGVKWLEGDNSLVI